jgi:hypothetical protein
LEGVDFPIEQFPRLGSMVIAHEGGQKLLDRSGGIVGLAIAHQVGVGKPTGAEQSLDLVAIVNQISGLELLGHGSIGQRAGTGGRL